MTQFVDNMLMHLRKNTKVLDRLVRGVQVILAKGVIPRKKTRKK